MLAALPYFSLIDEQSISTGKVAAWNTHCGFGNGLEYLGGTPPAPHKVDMGTRPPSYAQSIWHLEVRRNHLTGRSKHRRNMR